MPQVNDRHYALVVGINAYPGLQLPLNGPVNDAREIGQWLVDSDGGGVPDGNVRVVLSGGTRSRSARPIKDDVDDALQELNEKATSDIGSSRADYDRSRLIIYVAGHGIMPGDGQGALLLANAKRGLYGRNLELRAYVDWYLRASVFAQVVVFADCCRNWFAQARGAPPAFDDPKRPGWPVASLTWYATGPDSPAYEQIEKTVPPNERRGYFTMALLEGLRGRAAARADGAITAQALTQYVSAAVTSVTKDKAVPQLVTVYGNLGTDTVLGVTRAQLASVVIHFPDKFTDPVELLGPDQSRTKWTAADGPWTLHLAAGPYAVVRAGTFDGTPFADDGCFKVDGSDRDVHL